MLKIDKETYAINNNCYYPVNSVKKQIILAVSLRKGNNHIIRLTHKDFGKTKKWNTFTVSRDGVIYQHYDDNYHSDFLGKKKYDYQSISIVLENMGSLLLNENNEYVNFLNEICEKDRVITLDFMGVRYWEIIDDVQFESVLNLCKFLCDKHNIPLKVIDFHHYHKNIGNFNGIVFKSNYFTDSNNMMPHFNISKFEKMLK